MGRALARRAGSAKGASAAVPPALVRCDGRRGDRRPGLGRGGDLDPHPFEGDAHEPDQVRHDSRPGGPRPRLRRLDRRGRRVHSRPQARHETEGRGTPPRSNPWPRSRRRWSRSRGEVVAPDGRPVAGAVVGVAYSTATPPAQDDQRRRTADSRSACPEEGGELVGDQALPWLVASAPGLWDRLDRGGLASPTSPRAGGQADRGRAADRRADPRPRRPAGRRRQGPGRPDLVRREWGPRRLDRQGTQRRRGQPLARAGEPAARPGPGAGARLAERLVSITRTTGADGRFKLTGIGRDRIAELSVSGPGLRHDSGLRLQPARAGDPHRRPGHDASTNRSSSTPPGSSSPCRRASGSRAWSATRTPAADRRPGDPAAVFDEHSLIRRPRSRPGPTPRDGIASTACPGRRPTDCSSARTRACPTLAGTLKVAGRLSGRWNPSPSTSR